MTAKTKPSSSSVSKQTAASESRDVILWAARTQQNKRDQIAQECAIALVYNGISHAVMMASPNDLTEFAIGFSLTESVITSAEQIYSVEQQVTEKGIELEIEISAAQFAALKHKRRQLSGRSGCGLCGVESLEQVLGNAAQVGSSIKVSHNAIQKALASLSSNQQLQSITGATHCAAWCDTNGKILLIREDIGRHNALDKLIGALERQQVNKAQGFVTVSSRASYEMVQKVASVGIELLVAVSSATTLAIDVANQSGVTLVGFAREGRHIVYVHPQRLVD
jgi:FdhD protein